MDFAQAANLYFSEAILLLLSSLDINATVLFCFSEKNEEETLIYSHCSTLIKL